MWHRTTTLTDNHAVHSLEYADAASRTSDGTLVAVDVGRVAKQNDDDSFWILANHSPLTWSPMIPGIVPDAMLFFGAENVGTTTTSRFLAPGYSPDMATTTSLGMRLSRAGTLRNLAARHNGVGVGGAIVYTVWVNSIITTLAVSLNASSSDALNSVDSVAVLAGDLIEIRASKASSITTSPTDISVTLGFGS